jgi:hypothetical protein
VLLFFLTSLLHYHALVQDLIIQLVSDSLLGLLILIFIQSAQIHPLLPVAEVLGVMLCLGLHSRLTLNAWNKELKRLESLEEMDGESEGEENEGEGEGEKRNSLQITSDPQMVVLRGEPMIQIHRSLYH